MKRVLAGMGLALLIPAVADGATLVRENAGLGDYRYRYEAAPGEVNSPELSITDTTFRISDAGAAIDAPDQCDTAAGGVVSCPAGRLAGVVAELGDGDDRLEYSVGTSGFALDRVDGGPGADEVSASADEVVGGDGDDALSSKEPFSQVSGGPGADALTAVTWGTVLQGGPDADTLRAAQPDMTFTASFADAKEPVTADLSAPGPMGVEGQQDDVVGADGVIGGTGDDRLTGDGEDNRLEGGAGDDALTGGAGSDEIRPGTGIDQVEAGGGEDAIRDAREAQPTPDAVLDGGGGRDLVAGEGSGAVLLGSGGNDLMRFGADNPTVDGGAGNDLMTPRAERSESEGVVCGAGGKDVASNFGRAPGPSDCEQLRIVDGGQDVVFPNRVRIDGRRLRIPAPNICLRPCDLELNLFLGNKPFEETALSRGRPGDPRVAVMELSAKSLRRVRDAGVVRIYFEAKGIQKIGDTFATFGNVVD